MDKGKLDVALETAPDNTGKDDPEIRTLEELELLLVGGGGDDTVCW
jgi:hypothetical protein